MPVEFLGADKIQCYYATNNGCLSNKLVEIIRENALKIATQSLTEMDVLAAQEEKKATNYLCWIAKIYADKKGCQLSDLQRKPRQSSILL